MFREIVRTFVILIIIFFSLTPSFAQTAKAEATVALKKAYGPWYKYHEVGKALLCKIGIEPGTSNSGLSSPDTSKIKKEVKRLSGKEVLSVDFHNTVQEYSGGYEKSVHLSLQHSHPLSINIVSEFDSSGVQSSTPYSILTVISPVPRSGNTTIKEKRFLQILIQPVILLKSFTQTERHSRLKKFMAIINITGHLAS